MASDAERLAALLRGAEDAHGTYTVPRTVSGGSKVEIKGTAQTLREPPTTAMWESHLRGDRGMGVIPIRADGTCWWGALDIDDYSVVHVDLLARLRDLRAPVAVCRTKSGGARVFLFLSETVAATELRQVLRALAAAIGYGECEIFPKQDSVLRDKGQLGNWIAAPYHGGDRTDQFCVREDGRGMSVSAFVDHALSLEQRLALHVFHSQERHHHAAGRPPLAEPKCLDDVRIVHVCQHLGLALETFSLHSIHHP